MFRPSAQGPPWAADVAVSSTMFFGTKWNVHTSCGWVLCLLCLSGRSLTETLTGVSSRTSLQTRLQSPASWVRPETVYVAGLSPYSLR